MPKEFTPGIVWDQWTFSRSTECIVPGIRVWQVCYSCIVLSLTNWEAMHKHNLLKISLSVNLVMVE